jgi:hypothetical protein
MEPDHKELLIGLIGSTYGELKRLDDSIIGTSSTLGRRSDQAKQELTNILRGTQPKPDVPALQIIHDQEVKAAAEAALANPPTSYVPPAPADATYRPVVEASAPLPGANATFNPTAVFVETGQLEFNLERVAKYQDILDAIETTNGRLAALKQTIDIILERLPERKKKVPGTIDS